MVLFITLFCALGTWQLYRLQWKMELISEINFGLNSTPIKYSNSIKKNYQRVISEGSFNFKDQILLVKEIVYVSKIMKKLFKTSKLNVEKIGNIVPQLHIHIIARSKKDDTWPLSVWVNKGKKYSKSSLIKILKRMKLVIK